MKVDLSLQQWESQDSKTVENAQEHVLTKPGFSFLKKKTKHVYEN